jgi:hypothetical protein
MDGMRAKIRRFLYGFMPNKIKIVQEDSHRLRMTTRRAKAKPMQGSLPFDLLRVRMTAKDKQRQEQRPGA